MSGLLLDTRVFLWWQTADRRLGPSARQAIAEPDNDIFVSAASVWEIVLKARRGKLSFSVSPLSAIAAHGFRELPILAADAEASGALDWHHADPFDRLLVAQAQRASAILVTADAAIRDFGAAPMLWAVA